MSRCKEAWWDELEDFPFPEGFMADMPDQIVMDGVQERLADLYSMLEGSLHTGPHDQEYAETFFMLPPCTALLGGIQHTRRAA
jgi:hypothetical protein